MSDDVVDIRKRIEEMRNEVSAAIVSGREQEQAAIHGPCSAGPV